MEKQPETWGLFDPVAAAPGIAGTAVAAGLTLYGPPLYIVVVKFHWNGAMSLVLALYQGTSRSRG
ncbi:MAG: hypothetical protein OXE40_07330, partial [Gammaproteobacteria bacterium]|nr:hypothetical protein [Gammaproteobacteria bacterium]